MGLQGLSVGFNRSQVVQYISGFGGISVGLGDVVTNNIFFDAVEQYNYIKETPLTANHALAVNYTDEELGILNSSTQTVIKDFYSKDDLKQLGTYIVSDTTTNLTQPKRIRISHSPDLDLYIALPKTFYVECTIFKKADPGSYSRSVIFAKGLRNFQGGTNQRYWLEYTYDINNHKILQFGFNTGSTWYADALIIRNTTDFELPMKFRIVVTKGNTNTDFKMFINGVENDYNNGKYMGVDNTATNDMLGGNGYDEWGYQYTAELLYSDFRIYDRQFTDEEAREVSINGISELADVLDVNFGGTPGIYEVTDRTGNHSVLIDNSEGDNVFYDSDTGFPPIKNALALRAESNHYLRIPNFQPSPEKGYTAIIGLTQRSNRVYLNQIDEVLFEHSGDISFGLGYTAGTTYDANRAFRTDQIRGYTLQTTLTEYIGALQQVDRPYMIAVNWRKGSLDRGPRGRYRVYANGRLVEEYFGSEDVLGFDETAGTDLLIGSDLAQYFDGYIHCFAIAKGELSDKHMLELVNNNQFTQPNISWPSDFGDSLDWQVILDFSSIIDNSSGTNGSEYILRDLSDQNNNALLSNYSADDVDPLHEDYVLYDVSALQTRSVKQFQYTTDAEKVYNFNILYPVSGDFEGTISTYVDRPDSVYCVGTAYRQSTRKAAYVNSDFTGIVGTKTMTAYLPNDYKGQFETYTGVDLETATTFDFESLGVDTGTTLVISGQYTSTGDWIFGPNTPGTLPYVKIYRNRNDQLIDLSQIDFDTYFNVTSFGSEKVCEELILPAINPNNFSTFLLGASTNTGTRIGRNGILNSLDFSNYTGEVSGLLQINGQTMGITDLQVGFSKIEGEIFISGNYGINQPTLTINSGTGIVNKFTCYRNNTAQDMTLDISNVILTDYLRIYGWSSQMPCQYVTFPSSNSNDFNHFELSYEKETSLDLSNFTGVFTGTFYIWNIPLTTLTVPADLDQLDTFTVSQTPINQAFALGSSIIAIDIALTRNAISGTNIDTMIASINTNVANFPVGAKSVNFGHAGGGSNGTPSGTSITTMTNLAASDDFTFTYWDGAIDVTITPP